MVTKLKEKLFPANMTPEERQKKILVLAAFAIFLLFFLVGGYFIGRPIVRFVAEPEQFATWVDDHGIYGRLVFIGMMTLQVVVAIIPGEPLEIGAGYAFGALTGTILCLISTMLGSTIVFAFTRRFGMRALEVFFSREQIHSLKFLQNAKRFKVVIFLLFLIPGTPKDLLTYFAGLTPIKLWSFLWISTLARIPSVITSTIGGGALMGQNYRFAIVVFAITVTVSLLGILIYRRYLKRQQAAEEAATDAPLDDA